MISNPTGTESESFPVSSTLLFFFYCCTQSLCDFCRVHYVLIETSNTFRLVYYISIFTFGRNGFPLSCKYRFMTIVIVIVVVKAYSIQKLPTHSHVLTFRRL